MDFLKDHEAVQQMLCLMRENGKGEEAEEFLWLIECVDNMEQQYSSVLVELQEIRKQLEQTQVPEQASMKDQVLDALQAVQEKLEQARNQLTAVKDKIISWTKNTLEDVKRLGITALDTAISTLGVQTMLKSMEDKTFDSMQDIQASIRKVETIGEELRSAGAHLKNAGHTAGEELRSAGAHLKNAGHTAIGRETQQVDGGQVGRFETAVLSPMRAIHSVLADMNRIIYSAEDAVDELKEAAEQCRGKHEKPSVRQQLEQKKVENAAISTPKPGKKLKGTER